MTEPSPPDPPGAPEPTSPDEPTGGSGASGASATSSEPPAPEVDPVDATPSVAGEPARHRAPIRWLTATTVAVAVVMVVAASAFGMLAFTENDGAANPEDAVRAMLEAVRDNDVLGVIDLLPPGERRALRDPASKLAPQLQRVGLIGATDPRHIIGPELQLDDVTLRTTQLTEGMDVVELTGGGFTFRVPGGAPPLTDKARQALERDFSVTVDMNGTVYSRDFATDPLRVVTIREGGGWHVSLAYTVADALLRDHGAEMPKMGTGPPASGSETPEDAVRDLMSNYADGDAEHLVTLMYPDETRALYDFAPAFLPQISEAIRNAQDQGTYDVQINELKTAVEGSGATRKVKITALDMDIRDELKKLHIIYDGRCFHTDQRINDDDDPFAKTDQCNGDIPRPGDAVTPRDNPVSNLAIFGGGVDLPTFTVVERNGRWFISPARTLVDSLLDTLEHTSPEAVDAMADRFGAARRGGVGGGLSGQLIRPTAAEVSEDPSKARVRAAALVDACAALAEGPTAEQVTRSCVRRLVDRHVVANADLPVFAQQLVS